VWGAHHVIGYELVPYYTYLRAEIRKDFHATPVEMAVISYKFYRYLGL